MSPKKIVKTCAIVVTCAVIAICSFNFGNTDDEALVFSDYTKTTQNYNRVSVSTVVNQIEQPEADPTPPAITDSTPSDIIVDNTSWLTTCDGVHKQWGTAGFTYVYGGYKEFTQPDGNKCTVRTDCSGYVSYCLYVAGYVSSTHAFTSAGDYTKAGFVKVEAPAGGFTTESLVAGDIVAWPGRHVQIYAGPADDWWNWGSHYSCEDKYINVTDINTVDSKMHSLPSKYNLKNAVVFRAPTS